MLVNGDPIIFSPDSNNYVLANISNIKVSNKRVTSIDLSTNDLSSMETVEFSVRKICTTEVTDRIYWNGLFDGPEVNVAGNKCLPIHPLIELNPPKGMSKYYFDAQLIRDIGVDLQLHSTATASSSSNMDTSLKRKCLINI